LYNGVTPEMLPGPQALVGSEIKDRKTLRKTPPPILVTNATMLEYMLVRRSDAPILEKSQRMLRWVVLDEAHSYLGSNAAEISLLLRRVMEAFGRTGDPRALARYLTEPTVLLAYGVPLLLGALFLSVHLPIHYLLPEFTPAIEVAKVLMVGYYFFAVMSMPILLAIALDRQVQVVLLTGLAIGLNAALNYVLISFGYGIVGVAVGTGISYFAYCLAVLGYVHGLVGGSRAELASFYGLILLPFSWMVGLLLALERWLPVRQLSLSEDAALTALKLGLYLLLFSLSLLIVRRHASFRRLGEVVSLFRERVRLAPLA
jgi:hypothetical protein